LHQAFAWKKQQLNIACMSLTVKYGAMQTKRKKMQSLIMCVNEKFYLAIKFSSHYAVHKQYACIIRLDKWKCHQNAKFSQSRGCQRNGGFMNVLKSTIQGYDWRIYFFEYQLLSNRILMINFVLFRNILLSFPYIIKNQTFLR